MNDGVSVVIPAKNAGRFLRPCLASLLHQSSEDQPFEILVVDNESTDETVSIAKEMKVRIVHSSATTPAGVRNDGARQARFSTLAFLDSDCIAPETWVAEGYRALNENPAVGCVGGGCLANPEGTWVEKAWSRSIRPQNSHVARALPGASLMIGADLFSRLGGFDASLVSAEDDELCSRVRHQGLEVRSLPQLWVIHLGYPRDLASFFRKSVWHGSTQLLAHGAFGDATLILTWVWVVAGASGILTAPFAPIPAIGTLVVAGLMPALLAYRRGGGASIFRYPRAFTQRYMIAVMFLAGRTCGLARELFNRCTNDARRP